MSKLAENLIDIFKVVGFDKELSRLIYYVDDPLDKSKVDVTELADFYEIQKNRIVRAPKFNDLDTKEIIRVCMYFGNGSTLNRVNSDQDIIFDVYVHIDKFEVNEARSLKIIDRINSLLHDERVTGFGKMNSGRTYIIANPPNGYIGYKVVYTFGNLK